MFGTGTGRHRGRPSPSSHDLFRVGLGLAYAGGLVLVWLIGHDLLAGLLAAISAVTYVAVAVFAFVRFHNRPTGGLGRAGAGWWRRADA